MHSTTSRRTRGWPRMLAVIAVLAGTLLWRDAPVGAEDTDPTNSILVDKTNSAGGETILERGQVQPGATFEYEIRAACTSITADCVNLTVTDTFPAGVEVIDVPASNANRVVVWDGTTLTVTYIQPTQNPAGTGMVAGGEDTLTVEVELPADTTLDTGTVITNEATVAADNVAESATDPTSIEVFIPRVVNSTTTKSFTDGSAIAGDDGAPTTIELTGTNQSSASAEPSDMVIEDSTPETFEYLDVVGVSVTEWPAGADSAQLFVCPQADAPCEEADWVAGGTSGPPGTPAALALPGTVPADQVVGVRVVFTAPDGSIIEPGATGGVDIDVELRETARSTGTDLGTFTGTVTFDNCAATTVTDDGADPPSVTSDPACAPFQIVPPTLVLVPAKSFYPDANGNFQTDSGEHAVLDDDSGVSMDMTAQNESAFPIAEVTITEPVEPSEWEKFDASSVRLTFPDGAVNANVVIEYDDATSTTTDYPAPGPTVIDVTPPPRVTSITVTYTGDPDVDGGATIAAGSTAGLSIHGNLNELVDETDVPGSGEIAGVDNCAHFTGSGGGVPGTTGTFDGEVCDELPVEERNPSTGGEKTASQDEIPIDQPFGFTMRTTNNGNLTLTDVVVADPVLDPDGTPSDSDLFTYAQFLNADVQPPAMASRVTIDVFLNDAWQELSTVDEADYPDVLGVRGTIDVLAPTETFDLRLEMIARDPTQPVPETITNCYGITAAGGEYEAQEHCGPPLEPGSALEAAAINKVITPEEMPRPIPGLAPQTATVELTIQNEGNITARTLQITDDDADFWDAVDFVALGAIEGPAVGALRDANQIQVDALTDTGWVEGPIQAIGSASVPAPPADVRGLRFTFSDSSTVNDGYVLTPCTEPSCAGSIALQVQPRIDLRSTGEPVPDTLLDTATGAYTTRLHPDELDPALIGPVTDDLVFNDGQPSLAVQKGPEDQFLEPGEVGTFELNTTNTGTSNLPDLTVSDPIPEGVAFDQTFAGDGGEPYTVVWSALPDGYPAPPDPTFVLSTEGDRVSQVRWTFEDWDMPPTASVAITYQYTLEPGVTAGLEIVNTMGSSSPIDGLQCSDASNGQQTDAEWGAGLYCTDPADVTVEAGASFLSRKWVAGNPALGWFNETTGELVPVGGPGCLALDANGRTYTTNPCIALVNPGEQFHYVLRVQNAGTEPALEMTVIDTFPAPGDTGVLGADRGTEWATAPTLSGPATYTGPDVGEISYTSSDTVCIDDLDFNSAGCDPTDWDDPPGPETTALRLAGDFASDPLAPGGTVDVSFSMDAPVEIPYVSDPTVAWNSLAHAEVTQIDGGGERVLPPLEPLRVGVAAMYGELQVVKEIGDNPAGLPVDDLEYGFAYECTLSTGAPGPAGSVVATPTTPGVVEHIPAGSTCQVWETATQGGIPSATDAAPVVVEIEPTLDPDTPTIATATVVNDFPMGQVSLLKVATDGSRELTPAQAYPVTVDCVYLGEPLSGFPVEVELAAGEPLSVPAPVGAECTVVEADVGGVDEVTYSPASDDGLSAQGVVPADGELTLDVAITNTYSAAALVVTKQVTGPAPAGATYTFEVACTMVGTDGAEVEAPLLMGDSPVDLAAGESEGYLVPSGSTCQVTETSPTTATVVIVEEVDDDADDGLVSVVDDLSLTVVNAFPSVDPAGADDAGAATGALALTGPHGLERIVAIGAALVLAGLGLVGTGRLRRT